MYKIFKIYTDGASRGNPGLASIGVVIKDNDGKTIATLKKKIGVATNNQAEYQALLYGLEKAHNLKCTEVHCYLDSKLVVEQLNQRYKIKNPDLAKIFLKIWNFKFNFQKIFFSHIEREQNSEADALANAALDEEEI